MTTNNYLTKEKKISGMVDFQNILNFKGKKSMQIEPEIRQNLININENELIQTLYSTFESGTRNIAYLRFAYHRDIELELHNKIIPSIVNKFNVNRNRCSRDFDKPMDNCMYDKDDKTGLRIRNDKDYFRINTVYIELKSFKKISRIEFWYDLEKKLKNLKL